METMVLKENEIFPTNEVVEKALGKSYAGYNQLMTKITSNAFDLTPQWHYYNDGKAWLCKVQYKKKTVFWLAVFEKYFKITFYFTEKNCKAVQELDIDPLIKREFSKRKPIGKLLPLTMNIDNSSKIKDVLKVIDYKKRLR